MKRLLILVLSICLMIPNAFAYEGTLSAPEQLQPLEATSFDWEFTLGTEINQVRGIHRWRSSDGTIIYLPGSNSRGWIKWTLRNHQMDSVPDVSNDDCTDVDTPNDCCTGDGTGTCDDLVDVQNTDCIAAGDPSPCCTGEDTGVCRGWSNTVLFDCGTSACDDQIIGVGLRTLIKNQWKKKYCPDCTISF